MSTTASEKKPWELFSEEKLREIEEARKAVEAKGEEALMSEKDGTYGKVCRACMKPNALSTDFCTGCSFPTVKWDIERLPDNIFLELVRGKDIVCPFFFFFLFFLSHPSPSPQVFNMFFFPPSSHSSIPQLYRQSQGSKVHFRDDNYLVFDDKFGISDTHLMVIPTAVYRDISELDASHIPMLERLFELGLTEAKRRAPVHLDGKDGRPTIEEACVAGYNFPVSVFHLHLHFALPPYKHEKVFQYPRWHPHQKVISDLKKFGKVQLYSDHPNDEEGQKTYDDKIKYHFSCLEQQKKDVTSKV